MPFFIDPDIRKARTLPSVFYTDHDLFNDSKEKIFARTWQFLAGPEVTQVSTPFILLPGFLDEPVLLVRRGGSAHCLSNVCTHRGKLIVESPCDANLLRCGYHGRRFSLEGKFLSMPEFEGVDDFPSAADNLALIALAEFGGFYFASIEPAAELEVFVDRGSALLDKARKGRLHFAGTRDYLVNAHWALYCENYLEGFHIPYVHPSLNEVVDYGTYSTEIFRYGSLQTGYESDGSVAGQYLFVFPNMMFNFYPWGLSVNVVQPIAPAKTVVRFVTYVNDPHKPGQGAGLHEIEVEDEAVVESVQKGVRSRFYSYGRYSPAREQGTHHFHRLIAEFMA